MNHQIPIARFEKVSPRQFDYDWISTVRSFDPPYDSIRLPRRATVGSAGYDFFLPMSIEMGPGQSVRIPTGIRVKIDEGWALLLLPRSSLGFRYRLQLDNTVGLIDSDYYSAANEGHIFAKLTNCGNTTLKLAAGEAFMQGVFVPFGIAGEESVTSIRTGGLGSTNESEA